MKLLVITRKVDIEDGRSSFMSEWLTELSKRTEHLYVITWSVSSTKGLNERITLHSLPSMKLFKVIMLPIMVLRLLPSVSGILCMQNPEYALLSAPFARLFGKKVVSWYAHGSITIRRRLMEIFSNTIVTSSQAGFKNSWFPSKLHIIGQGINTNLFTPDYSKRTAGAFKLLTVGRIAPTKDIESMIQAVREIHNRKNFRISFDIIGGTALSIDRTYFKNLQILTNRLQIQSIVTFVGEAPYRELPPFYQRADIFINLSSTGSLDKAVLEAMACECFVITSNEAYKGILGQEFVVVKDDYRALAKAILTAWALPKERKRAIAGTLRSYVVANHNLAYFAARVVQSFN